MITYSLLGLSPRAGHNPRQIKYLHGSLFNLRCSSFLCDYREPNNFVDPVVPALAIPTEDSEASTTTFPEAPNASFKAAQTALARGLHGKSREVDISDAEINLARVPNENLPHCPDCEGLLRPDVVWFGEALDKKIIDSVDGFIGAGRVDLMVVIGTSAAVWPAAGYIHEARQQGARVAVINMDPSTGRELHDHDWFFEGDASQIIPALFKDEIGDLPVGERSEITEEH